MTTWNRETITELLRVNDKAVCRALVILKERQTAEEQVSETTREHNGRGFTGFDAKIGTNMANFYQRFNRLTEKQIAVWRKTDKHGNMKIAKYWRQILEEIERSAQP